MKKGFLITIALSLFMFSGCSNNNVMTKQAYRDKFPQPCTDSWFIEIEHEVNLENVETGRPPAGSPQWLLALEEKYSIAKNTTTEVGSHEWCHQVHQQFVGF